MAFWDNLKMNPTNILIGIGVAVAVPVVLPVVATVICPLARAAINPHGACVLAHPVRDAERSLSGTGPDETGGISDPINARCNGRSLLVRKPGRLFGRSQWSARGCAGEPDGPQDLASLDFRCFRPAAPPEKIIFSVQF